MTTRK